MFPKYFSHLTGGPPHPHPSVSVSSLVSPAPPPPLLWSCLNSNSAAAELLQLARKSKERSELDNVKQPAPSPSPPAPSVSPVASSIYKPLLKFSVNAILARESDQETESKPAVTSLQQRSPSHSPPPAALPPSQSTPVLSNPPSPGYISHPSAAPPPRPFLPHPIIPPHLHPLLYQQSTIPRTGFTLPGSGTTLFPLPGTFPWSSGFRGE